MKLKIVVILKITILIPKLTSKMNFSHKIIPEYQKLGLNYLIKRTKKKRWTYFQKAGKIHFKKTGGKLEIKKLDN